MKFDLMYYLGLGYNEVMRVDLGELRWMYDKLRKTKESESELEALKLEATLAAATGGKLKGGGGSKAAPGHHKDVEMVEG